MLLLIKPKQRNAFQKFFFHLLFLGYKSFSYTIHNLHRNFFTTWEEGKSPNLPCRITLLPFLYRSPAFARPVDIQSVCVLQCHRYFWITQSSPLSLFLRFIHAVIIIMSSPIAFAFQTFNSYLVFSDVFLELFHPHP